MNAIMYMSLKTLRTSSIKKKTSQILATIPATQSLISSHMIQNKFPSHVRMLNSLKFHTKCVPQKSSRDSLKFHLGYCARRKIHSWKSCSKARSMLDWINMCARNRIYIEDTYTQVPLNIWICDESQKLKGKPKSSRSGVWTISWM